MKCISVVIPATIAAALTACDTMNRPISGGSFDPLAAPGSEIARDMAPAAVFQAGQFARAGMDNTAFFNNKPTGDAEASKLLARGTSMKVIALSGSYAKVELDSGEIGFVPTVMLEDPNAANQAPVTNAGEYQVYPPVGFGTPLPPTDPSALPPEGAIPTVIDPDAPAMPVPVTPPPTVTDEFPTTAPGGPAPLPPNEEDLKAAAEKNAEAGPEAAE